MDSFSSQTSTDQSENTPAPNLGAAEEPNPTQSTAQETSQNATQEIEHQEAQEISEQKEEKVVSSILQPLDKRHPNYDKAQWFALHVLSGQESKVRDALLKRLKANEMVDSLHEVIVPTERVSEIRRNKKIETERKLYPGYVFILANLLDDNKKIIEKTWYYLRETQGVLGFADGQKPIPMRNSEVEAMLAQIKASEEHVIPKTAFSVGDKVKVGDGPFQNQDGLVEEVYPEKGRLLVSVSIFGRSTPVELEYWQVEKT
ncbi:MAG: transcription termination/antitermination protein NusG [Verrucomicrobiae bacterium]|nr:transcription termination/antitermination protein NusG [Verrucomicrobiae bacterium]